MDTIDDKLSAWSDRMKTHPDEEKVLTDAEKKAMEEPVFIGPPQLSIGGSFDANGMPQIDLIVVDQEGRPWPRDRISIPATSVQEVSKALHAVVDRLAMEAMNAQEGSGN